jgi:hypothetical protein
MRWGGSQLKTVLDALLIVFFQVLEIEEYAGTAKPNDVD